MYIAPSLLLASTLRHLMIITSMAADGRWVINGKYRKSKPPVFYLVTCKVSNAQGEQQEHEAGFFCKAKTGPANSQNIIGRYHSYLECL